MSLWLARGHCESVHNESRLMDGRNEAKGHELKAQKIKATLHALLKYIIRKYKKRE